MVRRWLWCLLLCLIVGGGVGLWQCGAAMHHRQGGHAMAACCCGGCWVAGEVLRKGCSNAPQGSGRMPQWWLHCCPAGLLLCALHGCKGHAILFKLYSLRAVLALRAAAAPVRNVLMTSQTIDAVVKACRCRHSWLGWVGLLEEHEWRVGWAYGRGRAAGLAAG